MYNADRLAKADWKHSMDFARKEGMAQGEARGIAEGEARGELKSKLETAREMKEDGMPFEQIAKFTKLSAEDIEKL